MGLFGRRRDRDRDAEEFADDFQNGHVEGSLAEVLGPYDEADAPDDGVTRLDLGSVLLPVPDEVQLHVEMNPDGSVLALYVLTDQGQFTVSAYAAPKSGGQWEQVCGELADEMREQGASMVRSEVGDWGQELVITSKEGLTVRFVGVDGPRWMLRGVAATTPDRSRSAATVLREMMRGTVVVRGPAPMPPTMALPIVLPPEIAEHFANAQDNAPG